MKQAEFWGLGFLGLGTWTAAEPAQFSYCGAEAQECDSGGGWGGRGGGYEEASPGANIRGQI